MISINTNLSSLIAQNSLTKSSNVLNTAIERMTTGYKINHASDNAANYSISTDMTTKIGAYQVAEDNVSMGLDMLSTASSSINQMQDLTSRLRALATQAHNGTYGKQSLKALNQEAGAIIDELFRIKNTTEYNGINLFSSNNISEVGMNAGTYEVEHKDTSEYTSLSEIQFPLSGNLPNGKYSISTADDLAKLATLTNQNKVKNSEFILTNDIDLSDYQDGEGWVPIGRNTGSFKGIFDGNGYSISNLHIDRTSETDGKNQGLFGFVLGATIKNLNVMDCDVQGYRTTGGLVGYANDTSIIENCSVFGNIKGNELVGGIAGLTNCGGTNCSFQGTITAIQSGAGGLVSNTAGEWKNCFAICDVSGLGEVGGLIGYGEGKLVNSFAAGTVTGMYGTGGLIGGGGGVIDSCQAMNTITCAGISTGGLIGYASHNITITNSIFNGEITANEFTGGIIGPLSNNGAEMQNCIIKNCELYSNINVENIITSGVIVGAKRGTGSWDITIDRVSYNSKLTDLTEITNVGQDYNGSGVFDANRNFQVGINSNESSQIQACTSFALNEVKALKTLGLQNSLSLEYIDKLTNQLSDMEVHFGAAQNRFESALNEIFTQYENLVSSRSTLQDADVAKESSVFIKQQILQQASVTLLATANQAPAIALQLL